MIPYNKLFTLNYNSKKAFTLVELAIVLVIIGLLTVGVIGGTSLIKSAKVRSVQSQLTGYITATRAFQLEYDWLPGDMINAYDYWGANCDATNYKCNGNGDKMVNARSDGPFPDGSTGNDDNESSRFWQHLSLAGLISGKYPGVVHPGDEGVSPSIKIEGGGIQAWWGTAYSAPHTRQSGLFMIGKRTTQRNLATPIMSSADAKKLDQKIDDGMPNLGSVSTMYGSGWTDSYMANCKTGGANDDDTAATYDLSYTGAEACIMMISW